MQEPYNQPPVPPTGGHTQPPAQQDSKKLTAGICGILLGYFGIHKFILGYTTEGIIMLLLTVIGSWFTCGITGYAMAVIGLVEGILYLTKTDQEFYQTYVLNRRGWF